MRLPVIFRTLILTPIFLIPASVFAQSPTDDLDTLPTTLSAHQLESLFALAPAPPDPPQPSHDRRRLPRIVTPLTPEEPAYRDAVRTLGVDKHRFVHLDLSGGKVRTGAILEIHDEKFRLSDGILNCAWISYSQLSAAPQAVPAIGTHALNGLKWTGLVAGIVVGAPVAVVLFYPLVLTGVLKD